MTKSINDYAKEIHTTAVEHGWYNDPETGERIQRNFGEVVALMHSELSESLEHYREGNPLVFIDPNGKPDGMAVELIDCVIRIFDTLHELGVNVEEVLDMKMEYNESRPYRHGGKKA